MSTVEGYEVGKSSSAGEAAVLVALPRRIVVYDYYGQAVYFDGELAAYYHTRATDGWDALCRLLGIAFERRRVCWEDWPGAAADSQAVYSPPHELEAVERHFRELDRRRRRERVEQIRAELRKLEGEAGGG